ncbi:MAG: LLM class flavin-dependent oxidoreductase [Dehalococcoidia bacterium]|jgi:probable F420-dependent oxidoreductase|nr:LLM class flavin-dependent oxidoreductase [Dehalococcoidia bacterium]
MERIGVAFSGGMSPTDVVECVQLAEELGYESAWMSEGHGGDQFSVLTACAVATNRILLGTGITSVFVRSAPTIAMAAACVDHFSHGRFILGLGTSHKVQVEPEHGLMFSQAVPRLRDCVQVVRDLLRQGEVSLQGSVFNIDYFDLAFQPYRREIPIYVAAVFPKMLETCGEIAQGALLTWCTLENARTAVRHVALGAERAGKDPKDVEIATLLRCAIDTDKDQARNSLRNNTAFYAATFPRYRKLMADAGFGDEMEAVRQAWQAGDREKAMRLVPTGLLDKMTLLGSPEEYRQRLQEYREAGITQPIISPRVSEPDSKGQAMRVIRSCAPQ